ncbi:DUF3592 domain-containing protein [Gordonia sp. NB41Y]|uniref:DUF3592 domain-containing protein n=1 Tax=Gordonia sp. NB41Y TaxID=875808 RepID=UPI00273BEC0D|nr:DUF3592 domain-containing protein [Gordonia sp. NB41Y]WLP92093.1 hypothetical protein Q9K23_07620 [Gordonia sp. NB41Y]
MSPVILRRVQKTLLVIGLIVTVLSACIVVAAYRNDAAIDANKGTVMADIVSADRLHAVAYFQTPDGQIVSPRLGLLYPTELGTGQRISVEYDTTNPDLARPAGRDWTLSIIPAASVAVIGWIVVVALMLLIAEGNRRWVRWSQRRAAADDDGPRPEPGPADERETVDA